ncbi:hypothetical protein JST97_31865 [bacterium]|nr:hypothetical protein [bacterium]
MDYLASLADSFGSAFKPAEEEEQPHGEEEQQPPVPAFYMALYEATEAVALGDLAIEDWMAVWHRVVQTLEAMSEQIEAQVERVGQSLGPEVQEAGELLLAGVEEALDALEVMGNYLDVDRNPEHLTQGWEDLMDASDAIARAMLEYQRVRAAIGQIPPETTKTT